MLNFISHMADSLFIYKKSLFFTVLSILSFVMLIDYITGMLAAKKESLEHPNDRKYGWSSKKSIRGIYKKAGYIVIVLVAVITDYSIFIISAELGLTFKSKTLFALLVSIWLIINELISILENSGRMGAQLPEFLKKTLSELKKNIDNTDSH